MELFLRSGNMSGKKKGTQRVQCARCGQTFTEKQFEKHKRICRGDEPPALSGEEDNSDFSDAEFVVIEDEYDGYPREEIRRNPEEIDELIRATGQPVMKGRRVGEDSKWRRVKRVKGRIPPEMGMEQLKMIVGSQFGRDIKRRPHFMAPEAFTEWQKVHDKKGRYWAEEMDIDGDKIKEFSVGRYKGKYNRKTEKWEPLVDEEGNPERELIAVNGWTTVKSDYPERREYFNAYPTAKDRKGKPFTKFIHSKYYTDDDKDEFGYPKHEYIEKRANAMYSIGHKYKLHMPLPTARSDFMKNLIWEAYKKAVDFYIKQHPGTERKDVKIATGFVVSKGAELWRSWILEAFFENVRGTEYYNGLLEKYIKKFNRAKFNKDKGITYNNEEHREKFEKTLLKNDSVRKGINELVHNLLDKSGPYYKDSFQYVANIFYAQLEDENDDILD